MSRTALVIALLLALCLGVGAYFLTRGTVGPGGGTNQPGTPGGAGGPGVGSSTGNGNGAVTLTFDPGRLSAIEVTGADGRVETVRRATSGAWLHQDGPAGPPGAVDETDVRRGWPILPERARTAIRSLSNLESLGRPDDGTAIRGASTQVRIILRDGSQHVIRISGDTLGGRTLAEIDGSPALIDASLAASFTDPGPSAWRLPWAMPGVRDASRLRIQRREEPAIAVHRVMSRWAVTSPISAPANPAAITGLQDVLADIQIDRFLSKTDQPDAATMGLDDPALILVAEEDVRRPIEGGTDVEVVTRRRELRVGGPANVDGSMLYASPDEDGSLVFLVPANRVYAMSTAPRNYLALTAAVVPAAEVHGIDIETTDGVRQYRRDAGRWMERRPSGSADIPADDAEVDRLLAFLTRQPAEADVLKDDDDIETEATIRLFDRADGPLAVLRFGTTADGVVAIVADQRLLQYSNVSAPSLLPSVEDAAAAQTSAPTDGFMSK